MSIGPGNLGVVDVDGTVVAEVRGYDLDTGSVSDDTTPIGQDWQRMSGALRTVSASIDATYDPADPGQLLLVAGATVTLKLTPQGIGPGLPAETITDALVTSARESLTRDAYVTVAFTTEGGNYVPSTQV